jgi:hypothetical protein
MCALDAWSGEVSTIVITGYFDSDRSVTKSVGEISNTNLNEQGNAGPYVFQSYEEVARRVDNFGSGASNGNSL